MLIKIYNSKGLEQAELSPNDNSTLVEEIQGDSILTLSFTHFDYLELDVDFYTDFEGKRYWLTEKYKPKQNNKKEWVYDVKFYGVESMLKRLLVIKTVDDEEDPVFTLTAPPHEHVAMIVDCMNKGMGNISDWKVGRVEGGANIVIDYFGKYCDEALREIAEKVGGEWWAEGQTVNICKCEHGETVKLGYGNGLLSIDPGTADNVKFYTRLYPVGSSKNIDKEHYGYNRLQLPDGKKFVEINADKYGRVDHYEQDAFSEIYPRRIGTVSSVRSEEVTGEDGNPFTIYYFKDSSLSFDPNDYLLPEKVIRVSFQEGSELGGLGNEDNGTYYFEVNFDSKTREFEIITIWPYGNEMQLPGDLLIPKPGDKYILWNLRMPDEYYALAEQEFLEAVKKYNEDHGLDIAVYKAPTDHVWIEKNKIDLSIGRRVRLESDEYFPGIGYRDSRITRITRKVNLPTSMELEISDALSKTSQEKITDAIDETRNYARSIGESISLPDIIRTGDNTRPTDNNLLSALKTVREFLSKKNDDSTPFGLSIGGILSDTKFKQGLLGGAGWGIFKDENGKSVLETDILNVREEMFVNSLTVNQIKAIGGMNLYSLASIEVTKVETYSGYYRCFFELKSDYIANLFRIDDVGYCHRFTPENANLKYYKRKVIAIGEDYIDLSRDSQFVSGTGTPEKGDVIAQYGNYTDKNRQFVIILDVQGGGYMRYLGGLDSVNALGKEYGFQGYQSSTGERWFIGDKDGEYAEWVLGKLNINGSISVTSTIGDKKLEDFINDVTEGNIEQFVKNYTEQELEDIKGQLDGKAETWYQATDPSTIGRPNGWKGEENSEHKGDLWYNTTDKTTWIWNGTKWDAMDIPESVFNTINGKSSIFVSEDPHPYKKNDLWFLPKEYTLADGKKYPSGTLAIASQDSEIFVSSHWSKKDRYTDDTVALEALGRFSAWADDGVFSPLEAKELENEKIRVNSEHSDYQSRYATYKDIIDKDTEMLKAYNAYNSAYTAYIAQIDSVLNAFISGTGLDADGCFKIPSGFEPSMKAYYESRIDIETALAKASKIYSLNQIADYEYLKRALNDTTTINGGLMLTSLISLGITKEDNTRETWAGISGIYDNPKSIASWWGGIMADKFATPQPNKYAAALVRMDGSSYFSNGNIQFNADGSACFGNNQQLYIGANGDLYLNNGIKIVGGTAGSTDTLESIVNFLNNFSLNFKPVKKNGNAWEVKEWKDIKSINDFDAVKSVKGFFSEAFISALGLNDDSGSSSGGGKSYLWELLDINENAVKNPASGQVLTYRNGKWTAEAAQASGLDYTELSQYLTAYNYATQDWVTDQGYLTSHQKIYKASFAAGIFSAKEYNPASAEQSINIPTKTSHLTNDSGFITKDADITGNAATATRLKGDSTYTAWGQTFFSKGVPVTATGDMSDVGSISASGILTIEHTEEGTYTDAISLVSLHRTNKASGLYSGYLQLGVRHNTGGQAYYHGFIQSRNYSKTASYLFLNPDGGSVIIGSTAGTDYKLYVSGTAYISGVLSAPSGIQIGSVKITYNTGNKGLHIEGGGLYSDSYISAYGVSDSSGGSGGGSGVTKLSELSDVRLSLLSDGQFLVYNSATQRWVNRSVDLSGGLDKDSLATYLEDNEYATWTWVRNYLGNNKYTTEGWVNTQLGSYVTLGTDQTINGKKTFTGGIGSNNLPEDKSMPYFLGINSFAEGGIFRWIRADNVCAAIGAVSSATLANYVTTNTAQTITGAKTFNNGCWIIAANESNEITSQYCDNNKWGANQTNLYSIRNSLRFRWFNTYWYIGNIRGSSTDSYGFGIGSLSSDGAYVQPNFRVATNNSYINGNAILHTGNYTSYINPANYVAKSGDTMTGNLTLPKVILSGGTSCYLGTIGSYTELHTNGNEIVLSGTASNIWVNYRKASDGNVPIDWIWGNGEGAATARFRLSTIRIQASEGNYCEGIRIKPFSSFSTIVLGGDDLTADSGTSANTWSIHNNNGNFYINKNGWGAQQSPRLWGHSNGWTVGNYATTTYALNAASFICGSWVRTYGDTGWYSESYGGGIYMTDTTWIRTYGSKSFYHNTGIMRTDGALQVGANGARFIVTDGGNTGIGTTSPSYKLHVAGVTYASYYLASSTTLCTNLNADLLDGVHYQNILERSYTTTFDQRASDGVAHWYRVGEFMMSNSVNPMAIIMVGRNYYSPQNEGYIFAISVGYNGQIDITQLSGVQGGALIDSVRIDWRNSNTAYLDIHVKYSGNTSYVNRLYVTSIGAFKTYASASITIDPSLLGTAYEFATGKGFININGVKLPTKKLWGQDFNGTGNVTGSLYNVDSIEMRGNIIMAAVSEASSWTSQLRVTKFNRVQVLGFLGRVSGFGDSVTSYEFGLNSSAQNPGISINASNSNVSIGYGSLYVVYGGNVGIGTTNPGYKLDVDGAAHASSLYLTTTAGRLSVYTRTNLNAGEYIQWSLGKASSTYNSLVVQYYHVGDGSTSNYATLKLWSGGNTLNLTGGGNVGIGTVSPSYKLHVVGVIYSTTGIFSDGYVSAKGQNTSSDARLKRELERINLNIHSIGNAPSIRFKWRKDGTQDVGSIAQYWEKILPQTVRKDPMGYLSLDYGKAALISAISIAREVINDKERIRQLEKRVEELERQLGK